MLTLTLHVWVTARRLDYECAQHTTHHPLLEQLLVRWIAGGTVDDGDEHHHQHGHLLSGWGAINKWLYTTHHPNPAPRATACRGGLRNAKCGVDNDNGDDSETVTSTTITAVSIYLQGAWGAIDNDYSQHTARTPLFEQLLVGWTADGMPTMMTTVIDNYAWHTTLPNLRSLSLDVHSYCSIPIVSQ